MVAEDLEWTLGEVVITGPADWDLRYREDGALIEASLGDDATLWVRTADLGELTRAQGPAMMAELLRRSLPNMGFKNCQAPDDNTWNSDGLRLLGQPFLGFLHGVEHVGYALHAVYPSGQLLTLAVHSSTLELQRVGEQTLQVLAMRVVGMVER